MGTLLALLLATIRGLCCDFRRHVRVLRLYITALLQKS